MKGLKKLSIIFISVFVCIFSAVIFTGCDKDEKTCKLYVFSTQGGYVLVDDNKEPVEFGDEGSKTFVYKKGNNVKLKAVAESGYVFVKWECTDKLDQSIDLNKEQIEFGINDSEVVIRANFVLDGTVKCSIDWETGEGFEIVPLNGYSTEVDLRGDFKFKVNASEGYDLANADVKADGVKLTPDLNGVYTITNIAEDITITVGGAVKKEYKVTVNKDLAPGVEVTPEDGYTFNVKHAEDFKFTIVIRDDGHDADTLKVCINTTQLIADDYGVYTISNITSNVEINIEIESLAPETSTFTFSISVTEDIVDQNGDISFFMPDEVTFTLMKGEGAQSYNTGDLKLFDCDGESYSSKDFVDYINGILYDNMLGDYVLSYIALDSDGEQKLIEFSDDGFTVYWNIFQAESMNAYMILYNQTAKQ